MYWQGDLPIVEEFWIVTEICEHSRSFHFQPYSGRSVNFVLNNLHSLKVKIKNYLLNSFFAHLI